MYRSATHLGYKYELSLQTLRQKKQGSAYALPSSKTPANLLDLQDAEIAGKTATDMTKDGLLAQPIPERRGQNYIIESSMSSF
jgi:hypothetical protein